ncbi:Hypothetical Protein SLY_0358 [Strawberry lethal yellows phytoplasma (CPA) str. NZSb11]|uniref:Uncharacterized protein n=1 Tax=Strawberry lethal yellows phytoplasma (CPA) str. NZSb11 TaxID=980422 RepID=R4S0J0_PHYAS|nr:Hypothetical Protein SLY_0358 [Strawberry lethal yellows phytoplasma (CPA) str. NZSb11]
MLLINYFSFLKKKVNGQLKIGFNLLNFFVNCHRKLFL